MIYTERSPYKEELAKYQEIWTEPSYGRVSPGAKMVNAFIEIAQPKAGETLIELGSGMGLAGYKLAVLHKLDVTWMDICAFDELGLEPNVRKHFADHPGLENTNFIQGSLWEPSFYKDKNLFNEEKHWKYGYCCDVMEHLPVEYTMLAIHNMMQCCDYVFFMIALFDENFKELVDKPLHLTVMPYEWWRDHLADSYNLLDSRHLIDTESVGDKGMYYVTKK